MKSFSSPLMRTKIGTEIQKYLILFMRLSVLILIFSALFACEKKKTSVIPLVIHSPVQELNTVSDPNIGFMKAFLTQAAADFASKNKNNVAPEVKIFNKVDELKAVTGNFDTPDAPDILYGFFFNLSGYVDTGRVVPLDDMVSNGLWDDIDPFAWELGKRNGKIYILPFLNMQNILIYNKEMFKKCGLESYIADDQHIQNWSIEQWDYILDTLARRLPEGEYPLAMYAKNNQGDTHLLTFMRAFGGRIFNRGGNFDFQDPKVVRALTWLQDGVRKGWYPPQAANLEFEDCRELFANGQLAICMFNNTNRYLYGKLENFGFVNYPGKIATAFYSGFIVFDNGDPKRLKAAMDFLTFIYSNDKWRDLSAGNLPASSKTMRRYHDEIVLLDEFDKNSVNVINFMQNSPNWNGREDSVRNVLWPWIHRLLELKITPEQCAQGLDKVCNEALAIGRKNRKLHP